MPFPWQKLGHPKSHTMSLQSVAFLVTQSTQEQQQFSTQLAKLLFPSSFPHTTSGRGHDPFVLPPRLCWCWLHAALSRKFSSVLSKSRHISLWLFSGRTCSLLPISWQATKTPTHSTRSWSVASATTADYEYDEGIRAFRRPATLLIKPGIPNHG